MSVLNKRIRKKLESRLFYPKYKDFKREVLNPWKNCVREQKRLSKLGRQPITRDEVNDLLELGIYTEEEIRWKFKIINNEKGCLF